MLLSSTKDLSAGAHKIISLVPSQTELLSYFGLEKEVIGITRFCIHPNKWYKDKHRIGGTKTVNIDKVRGLQPDLIIANKEENTKTQVEMLASEFAVWVTDVNNLEGSFDMINDIGELTNNINKAQALIIDIRKEFLKIPVPVSPVRACYLVWRNPYMTVGGDTFINNMIKHCGFQNIFEDKYRYPQITLEEIKGRNCDLVLLPDEPYPFKEKHVKEIQELLPGIKIMLADGEMFSWYGSRLLKAPGYFAALSGSSGLLSLYTHLPAE